MGNAWARCCESEDFAKPREGSDSDVSVPLIPSLRASSSLPALHSKAEERRESRRVVRIESFSPTIVEDYETGSEESEEVPVPVYFNSPSPSPRSPIRYSTSPGKRSSPKFSSGLRLLLTKAPLLDTVEVERKEDEEDLFVNPRALRRVERLDSLHSVIDNDESDVMFASAPVAAMKDLELPKGLKFALLDDSLASRTNFAVSLKENLCGSDESFIFGKTVDEVKIFPLEVISRMPGIVILNQWLQYESVSSQDLVRFKGTDIAKEIRQLGYDGCILMQSEDDNLKFEVDFSIVDGVIGKSTPNNSFAIGRMVALARRKNKLFANAGLPMPSSTHSSWNSRAESSFSFEIAESEMHKYENET